MVIFSKEKWQLSPFTKREKIHTEVFSNSEEASKLIAKEIAFTIKKKESTGKPCVLGLATGSSPLSVYKELIRLHQEEGLSFNNVITFNLDEYYPIQPHELQSYVRFMNEHLFNHIDIKPENILFIDKDSDDIKLIEFGMARVAPKFAKLHDHVGTTAGYMAPEVMCRQNHGFGVDNYAVGVIAYECMMGRRPY